MALTRAVAVTRFAPTVPLGNGCEAAVGVGGGAGGWGRLRTDVSATRYRQGHAENDRPGSLSLARVHARDVLMKFKIALRRGEPRVNACRLSLTLALPCSGRRCM